MAPLLQQMGNFVDAANCLQKVVNEESSDIAKVGLLTKIAGNYKKASKERECIEASKHAFTLMNSLSGEKDPQTCRCKLNLAQVYQHFEKPDDAKKLYEEFLALYTQQNGSDGAQDWSKNETFTKLKAFAEA